MNADLTVRNMTDPLQVDPFDDAAFYPHRPAQWGPIIARAVALQPQLRERAGAARKARMVPDENMRALFEQKLLRQYQPKQYGGSDVPWGVHFHIGRVLAQACPATAWISCVVASQMTYALRYHGALPDVFAKGHDVLMGNASAGIGAVATLTDGGFKLSGRWRFLSGADHIDWALLASNPTAGSNQGYMMLVPRSDMIIDDTWHVVGLQATGSKDVVVTDAFVPKERVLEMSQFWGAFSQQTAEKNMFTATRDIRGYVGSGIMGPLIGMAEGALLAYINITKKRVGATTNKTVADSEVVQIRLGESAAEIRAARTLMEQQFQFLREAGEGGRDITEVETLMLGRDRSIATRLCLDAVERLTRQMGAIGIFETNPVHAFHQDLRAAAGQIAVNFDRNMQPYGQSALSAPVN
jgi:3-hydroxy-9,10-secoandrosta-1,3,5(10)-triene-9,17-dione monooxygenase